MRQRVASVIWKTGRKKHPGKAAKTIFLFNEENLRNSLDNMKCNEIHMMGIPEGDQEPI